VSRLGLIIITVCTLLSLGASAVQSGSFDESEPDKTDGPIKNVQSNILPEALEQLTQHKILITNRVYRQIYEPYINPTNPVFITSDTVINAFHVLFNESVSRFEKANAHKLLDVLKMIWAGIAPEKEQLAGKSRDEKPSKGHQNDMQSTYSKVNGQGLRQAARVRARIVIAVAIKLLGDTSIELEGRLKKIVEKEVDRVVRAEDLWLPKWFGNPSHGFTALDYSHYKPRGFYTRSKVLERYFRALSWLQSIPFRVDEDEELMAILLLGKTFSDPYDNYAKRLEVEKWFRCYSETVGQADDWDLLLAAQIVRGRPTDLDTVREFLLKPKSKLENGSAIHDQLALGPEFLTQSSSAEFRIISPYRLPDALLFQRTTSLPDFERNWPNGLEVCAALGSEFAYGELAARVPGQYRKIFLWQIDESRKLFETKSFYNQYLYSLAALLDEPEPDAPLFMTAEAWKAKSCSSCLAGWAQHRHAWTLQIKQTAHSLGGASEILPTGFVEPEPEFFARMGELVERTKNRFMSCGAFVPPRNLFAEDLRTFVKFIEEFRYPETDEDNFKLNREELSILERSMLILTVLGDFRYSAAELTKRRPEIVTRIQDMADKIEAGEFDDDPAYQGIILETNVDIRAHWQSLEYICRRLEVLAHKQLRGAAFSEPENFFLTDFGERLAAVMLYGGDSYRNPNDDTPLIVDVYSNSRISGYLHVGVARPRELIVLYPQKDGEILCRGAVLSYYEFLSSKRLTDAEWRKRLDGDERPDNSDWLKPFISAGDPLKFENEKE
jgi:hypothetical protein